MIVKGRVSSHLIRKKKNRREGIGWQRGSWSVEQRVKRAMRGQNKMVCVCMCVCVCVCVCVCESERTPAVRLPCTREDCAEPAEMTEQTRAATRNTGDGRRKNAHSEVCVCRSSSGVCVHVWVARDSRWIDAPQQICLEERENFCPPRAFAFSWWKRGIQQSQRPPHYACVWPSVKYTRPHTHTHTRSQIKPHFTACSLQDVTSEQLCVTVNRHLQWY